MARKLMSQWKSIVSNLRRRLRLFARHGGDSVVDSLIHQRPMMHPARDDFET